MNRRPNGAGRAPAFTLIELLVTVAVLSIATIIVIPSMSQTGVLRVQAVARTIVADVSFAQADAMAYQTRRLIWFGQVPDQPIEEGWAFTSGNGYTIAEIDGPTVDLTTDFIYSPDSPDRPLARDFSRGQHVEVELTATFGEPEDDGSQWLIFDELGGSAADLTGPAPGPGGTVEIQSELGGYLVTIEPLTGRTTVERIEP